MLWVKGEPTCIEHILKLPLQNIKVPEIPILRFYLYLLPNRITLTHFLCTCVCLLNVLCHLYCLLYSLNLLSNSQKAYEALQWRKCFFFFPFA